MADELVDLRDQHGRIRQYGQPRNDAARLWPDLFVPVVSVVVIATGTGRVLVHQRAGTKPRWPDILDHVAGAVHTGEHPEAAVRREVLEEVGIHLGEVTPLAEGPTERGKYRMLYLGRAEETEPRPDPAEVAWVGWMDVPTLRQRIVEGVPTYPDFSADLELALQNSSPRLHRGESG
ncbi:NUDIX domain-containing protein [Nonomuraea sp. NPDC050790]|uniref:NUDIX domain-containing protein n=1 Tax=Nonomuraea sp. NPDC050790 TaxID=3364371 RepID=UPI0037B21558